MILDITRQHRRTGARGTTFQLTPEIDWRGVPQQFWGKVSAICRSYSECLDLNYWFGDPNFEPDLPVLLVIPNGAEPFYGQVCGMGMTPAYEIRDEAVARWEITEERLRRSGAVVDFDELREKYGYLRREDVMPAIAEAAMDKLRRHRASPVTNPPPQPKYPNPTNRQVFPVGDAVLPKEDA